jgi:hypothetical protein
MSRITERAHRKIPAKRPHRLMRLAAVACIGVVFGFLIFFFFFYAYAKATESCFLEMTEITLCCGTVYCPC